MQQRDTASGRRIRQQIAFVARKQRALTIVLRDITWMDIYVGISIYSFAYRIAKTEYRQLNHKVKIRVF